MNISIEKKEFFNAVHIVGRFAEHRNAALPALSSILILAGADGVKLRATNLETGIDLTLANAQKKSDGVAAIPASILQQLAGSFSGEGSLSIDHTGSLLLVSTKNGKMSIKTVSYDDFPSIPFPEHTKNTLILEGALLKSLFSSIATCASTSSIRPELSSIFFSAEGGTLTLVATDSFRLVERKVPLPSKGVQGKFLLPAKNALEIAHALPDTPIEIVFDEHQCAFSEAQIKIVSRLTNATYPDYRQIFPKEFSAEATIFRKDFEAAIKRTAVFADQYQKIRLAFDPKKNSVSFFSRNADIGESSEEVTAKVSGVPLELSFNHRYLATALSLTSSEQLSLSAAGIGRPLVIRAVADPSFTYLVSPMNQ